MKKHLIFIFISIFFACSNDNSNNQKNSSPPFEGQISEEVNIEFIKKSFKIIACKTQKDSEDSNLENISSEIIAKRLNDLNEAQFKFTSGGHHSTNAFLPAFDALQTLVLIIKKNGDSISDDQREKVDKMKEFIFGVLFGYSSEGLSEANTFFHGYYNNYDQDGRKDKSNRIEILNRIYVLFKHIQIFITKVENVIIEEDKIKEDKIKEDKIKEFLARHIEPYKGIFDALEAALKNSTQDLNSIISNFSLEEYFKESGEGGNSQRKLKSTEEIFQVITDKKIKQLQSLLKVKEE